MKIWQTIKQQSLLAIVSLVITFLIGEVYCRLFMEPIRYGFPDGMYLESKNPMIGYQMRPNFQGTVGTSAFHYDIKINNKGFRYNAVQENPNRPNIAIFGDSFAFGQGVNEEHNFSSVLYRGLGEKYNVINTGVCGYAPNQAFAVYKQFLEKNTPLDFVILQLFPNDIIDQEKTPKVKLYKGNIYAQPPKGLVGNIKSYFSKNSEFYCRLYLLKANLQKKDSNTKALLVNKKYSEEKQAEIESTKQLILEWKKLAEENNSTFLIFFIPDRLQVEPDWVQRFQQELGDYYDSNQPNLWLNALSAKDSSFHYLDFVQKFRAVLKTGELQFYFEKNGHCNEAGHLFIGEQLIQAIDSLKTL